MSAQLGQPTFDARRHLGVYGARHQPVGLSSRGWLVSMRCVTLGMHLRKVEKRIVSSNRWWRMTPFHLPPIKATLASTERPSCNAADAAAPLVSCSIDHSQDLGLQIKALGRRRAGLRIPHHPCQALPAGAAGLIAPQDPIAVIENPEMLDVMPLKNKSALLH